VLKEMLKVHPYEEAAYDIIPLNNEGMTYGIGRIAELEKTTKLALYADHVKHALGLGSIRMAGDPNKEVKKIALLNGTGNKFVNEARFAGADVLVTGDMQYHEIVDALEAGVCIIDAGHHATEKIMINTIAEYLRNKFSELKYDIEVIESKTNIDPISVV
jgi:putative NIF3 family GTP cyclohydrolase 1 type 2